MKTLILNCGLLTADDSSRVPSDVYPDLLGFLDCGRGTVSLRSGRIIAVSCYATDLCGYFYFKFDDLPMSESLVLATADTKNLVRDFRLLFLRSSADAQSDAGRIRFSSPDHSAQNNVFFYRTVAHLSPAEIAEVVVFQRFLAKTYLQRQLKAFSLN